MPGLIIERSSLGEGWSSISVEGEIDLATVGDLETAVEELFDEESSGLVIDLNRVSFMDSTGLRAMVMFDRRFREAGRSFAIAVNAGPISRLIDLSGVETSLTVVTDPQELVGT